MSGRMAGMSGRIAGMSGLFAGGRPKRLADPLSDPALAFSDSADWPMRGPTPSGLCQIDSRCATGQVLTPWQPASANTIRRPRAVRRSTVPDPRMASTGGKEPSLRSEEQDRCYHSRCRASVSRWRRAQEWRMRLSCGTQGLMRCCNTSACSAVCKRVFNSANALSSTIGVPVRHR